MTVLFVSALLTLSLVELLNEGGLRCADETEALRIL